MELDKCDDIGWFDLDNLPENMVEYTRQAIEMMRKGETYSEFE